MKKQIVSIFAVAGLSAASLAGAAEISVYGASAQFDFLNAGAVKYVQKYCTATVPALATGNANVIQYKTAMGNSIKNGVVTGTSCSGIPGSTDNFLTLRINGFGSGEGITTMTKAVSLDPEFTTGCNIANGERRMAPTGQATSPTLADGTTPANQALYVAATVCKPTNIGTSDVAYDQFTQFASDELVSATGLNTYTILPTFTQPPVQDKTTLAVPFAFYVNPGVKATHCVADLVSLKKTGGYCTSTNTEQCATGSVCETTPSTIDNISRLQATLLYSGSILNWDQLGGYFSTNPIKLCMRKPGSGTHVGFDVTVMRAAGKSGWGADYNAYANNDLGNALPYTNFAGSTTDMKSCLGGAEGFKMADGVTVVPFTGAIGYMDADNGSVTTYTKLKYNGVSANRTNVRNGAYEFYTVGHMYAENTALANDVVSFVQDPANIPSGKQPFWAAASEMKYIRGLDAAYPSKGGPTVTVTP